MSTNEFVVARCRDLATAMLFTGCALCLHVALRALLGPLPPFLVFYPAVAMAALFSGGWAALFTGVLAIITANRFFIPAHGSYTITRSAQGVAIGVLLFSCFLIVGLVNARKREAELAAASRAEAELASRKLEQASARLQAVFDNLEEGVLFVDAHGAGVMANAAVQRILGVTATDFSDPSTDPRLHSLDEEGRPIHLFEMPSARVLATGNSVSDLHINMPDVLGHRHWLKVNARPLFSAEGVLEGAVTSFSDITARKRADDELKAHRDRLELLIENAPVGLAMFDRQMRFLKVSRRFLEDFHIVGQNVIGRTHYEIFPDLPLNMRATHQRALDGEQLHSNGETYQRHDGSTLSVRWQIYPWRDVSGNVGGVILFTEDITTQRQAQLNLELAEERFRKTFLLSPFPVILINWESQIILDANEAQLQLMGRPREQVLGHTTRDFDFWVDNDRREQLRQTVNQLGSARAFRMRFRRGDGLIRDGVIDAQQLEIGGQHCVVNITRDITDELRFEQQNALMEKTQAVGRLAGGLAHDFNNLLGVITAATELAHGVSPADAARQLDRIRAAASRATELTGQLLTLSNHDVAFPRDIDLYVLLQHARRQAEVRSPGRGRVHLLSEHRSAITHADPSFVQRALDTLIDKALEVSEPAGITVRLQTVQFTAEAAGAVHPACRARNYHSISVTDSGPGMTPEQLFRLFEPFSSDRPGVPGDGLGYAAVQGVALQCGGFVDAHSTPGGGATITLYLPTIQPQPRLAPEPRRSSAEKAPGQAVKPVVLVVEDNDPLRELTVEMLGEAGFLTLQADSAEAALDLVSRDRPDIDLLLTDVIMPGRNGVELHSDFSASYPAAKVLFMSGYPSDILQSHNGAATEATFLQKPFNRKVLLSKVNSILKRGTESRI